MKFFRSAKTHLIRRSTIATSRAHFTTARVRSSTTAGEKFRNKEKIKTIYERRFSSRNGERKKIPWNTRRGGRDRGTTRRIVRVFCLSIFSQTESSAYTRNPARVRRVREIQCGGTEERIDACAAAADSDRPERGLHRPGRPWGGGHAAADCPPGGSRGWRRR